jgi:hypothetical protein
MAFNGRAALHNPRLEMAGRRCQAPCSEVNERLHDAQDDMQCVHPFEEPAFDVDALETLQ